MTHPAAPNRTTTRENASVIRYLPSFLFSRKSKQRRPLDEEQAILLPDRSSSSSSKQKSCWKPLVVRLRLYGPRRWLILIVASLMLLYVIITTILWMIRHGQCYSREAGVVWTEGPAHSMRRTCPKPTTIYENQETGGFRDRTPPEQICITTLSDSSTKSLWQWLFACRNFDAVQPLTWANQEAYANKHGYTIRDASELLDPSRPPAWSKIKAVQQLLGVDGKGHYHKHHHHHHHDANVKDDPPTCDWVLWMDTDAVFMNSQITLESLLPAADSPVDLIVTYDRRFGANSGVWLLRNSDWSREFLQAWWSMTDWVRPHGLSLSGDNAAFGHLIKSRQEDEQHAAERNKIAMIERCNLNSFGVFLTEQQQTEMHLAKSMEQQEWYKSTKFYHRGDFVAHASGIDQKVAGIELLLQRAT